LNIFVSNLSNTAEESDLKHLFLDFGEVKSTTIIKDKFRVRTMRFGFVEMPNDTEAQSAIVKLNGSKINGRTLNVHKARVGSGDRRSKHRGGGRRMNDAPELSKR